MSDNFLIMSLLQKYYWLDDALNRNLHRMGWPDVTRAQCLILIHVAIGVKRASTIARNLGVSRQALSQMLAEMKRRGLIDFKPDPADRRALIVDYSEEAASIRSDAVRTLQHIETELGKRIGKANLARLKNIISQDWGELPVYTRPEEDTEKAGT